jgi:Protein of unknown function (DUF3604)
MIRSWSPLALVVMFFGCNVDAPAPLDSGVPDGGDASEPGCDAGPAADAGLVRYTEEREACADRNPERNLYFGDLHVHTRLSFDAYGIGTRAGPEEAYRFARGEEIEIGDGTVPNRVRLGRPLDFAAVTDHAELLAEVDLCTDPESAAYGSATCVSYRQPGRGGYATLASKLTFENQPRDAQLCGVGATRCKPLIPTIWQGIRDAAERAYDRTSTCAFTSFVAYEYSPTPQGDMMHRNVIFRNASVPEVPVSSYEARSPVELWRSLRSECNACGGCDVLVIPHNSNQSAGRIYSLPEIEGLSPEDTRAMLTLRRDAEPLVEMIQHKGASECRADAILGASDEECGFELVQRTFVGAMSGGSPIPPCGGDGVASGSQCWSRLDYLRYVLGIGLEVEREHGVNPFTMGFIGSTDTHNATPGNVDEATFRGHFGHEDSEPLSFIENGPGGIAGVWAVENSRDALFEAMLRRETFATSGPRLALRFFAGHGWDQAMCGANLARRGYAEGVPMGGSLDASRSAPSFVVQANADPMGAGLAYSQVIKVWLDAEGVHQKVYTLGTDQSGTLDPATCTVTGGARSLCDVFVDPDWISGQPAVYYARVLETESCRWNQHQCIALPEGERPAACSDPMVPRTQRERAWSSPIWLTP